MAVKHVQKYFIQVANDYKQMCDTLNNLEKTITEDSSEQALKNLDNIKAMVEKLKENYLRISYIMFLLNKPNKNKKESRYCMRESKWLDYIGDNTLDSVRKENKEVLSMLTEL